MNIVPTLRRFHWIGYFILGVILLSITFSCATPPRIISSDEPTGPLPEYLESYAQRGPFDPGVTSFSFSSEFGCTLKVDVLHIQSLPQSNPPQFSSSVIVLAHGFLQNMDRMRGWAEHFASWGMTTAIVSFCNSSAFRGRHERNAQDLIQVSRRVSERLGIQDRNLKVWYGGFSAGGLSALLATSMDDFSVGFLGLDPVNSGGLANGVLPLEKPALFLFAEPSPCNAQGSMYEAISKVQLYESHNSLVISIPYATHCDFEFPTTRFCERICGKNLPQEVEQEIRRSIVARATWWIVSQVNSPAALESGSLSQGHR